MHHPETLGVKHRCLLLVGPTRSSNPTSWTPHPNIQEHSPMGMVRLRIVAIAFLFVCVVSSVMDREGIREGEK